MRHNEDVCVGDGELTWRFTLVQPGDDEATRYSSNPAALVVFVEE